MKYDVYGRTAVRPNHPNRRSIRLKGYDYAQVGAYFVTLCARDRACLFGEVVDGEVQLNEVGEVVADSWRWLATQYAYVELDEWIVMPNHIHGIVVLSDICRGGSRTAPAHRKPLGRLIGALKTASTKHIHSLPDLANVSVWQRNYYEHVLRNDEFLNRIRQYIIDNTLRWEMDRENPRAITPEPEDAWLI